MAVCGRPNVGQVGNAQNPVERAGQPGAVRREVPAAEPFLAAISMKKDQKMDANERRAKGEAVRRKVFGEQVKMPEDSLLWNNARDHLFAEIWAREVLSIRERRFLLFGLLAAMGEAGAF